MSMADNKLIFPHGLYRRRLSPRCRSPSPRSERRRSLVPARGASPSPPGGEAGGSLPGPAPLSLPLRPAAPAQPQRSAQHGHRCRRPRAPQETFCALPPGRCLPRYLSLFPLPQAAAGRGCRRSGSGAAPP